MLHGDMHTCFRHLAGWRHDMIHALRMTVPDRTKGKSTGKNVTDPTSVQECQHLHHDIFGNVCFVHHSGRTLCPRICEMRQGTHPMSALMLDNETEFTKQVHICNLFSITEAHAVTLGENIPSKYETRAIMDQPSSPVDQPCTRRKPTEKASKHTH